MRPASHPFWRFSLRTYRAPGVQEACLTLQDECGADVNVLLFCGWIGRQGRLLDADSLGAVIDCVGAWQSDLIAPLRRARRASKQQPVGGLAAALALPLRRRLAGIELDLERAEQALLADWASRWFTQLHALTPPQAIAANLSTYLTLLEAPSQPSQVIHQACIARASSPAE